jgi:beta-ureidopropionase / N-carbamoyl-L-amino-acid hydrolase
MEPGWESLRVNEERFRADFEQLSEFGRIGQTGVNRPALSEAHLAARAWLRGKIEQAGLEFRQDGAGNPSAILRCGRDTARTLLMGSHLDSVPTGGRFDGALGVLAALEVLRAIREAGLRLPFNLEAIDFTDEEGTLVSFLGSFAFAGLLKPEDLDNPRGDPKALQDGLVRAGLTKTSILSAHRDHKTLTGYLELHVEQGSRLYDTGCPIGVVTNISGISFYRLVFKGRPDHGSTPMDKRLDAALGASAFILSLRELILENFPECLANVGSAYFEPGAFNIVPETVTISLEFRAALLSSFQQLREAVLKLAEKEAARFGLALQIEFIGERVPVEMYPLALNAIRQAAGQLGLRTMDLISYAGHDAQAITSLCPTGMIFVPSANGGASHSPEEFTPWSDCVNGANVLLQAALRIADGLSMA